jgi:hypothetical protein
MYGLDQPASRWFQITEIVGDDISNQPVANYPIPTFSGPALSLHGKQPQAEWAFIPLTKSRSCRLVEHADMIDVR